MCKPTPVGRSDAVSKEGGAPVRDTVPGPVNHPAPAEPAEGQSQSEPIPEPPKCSGREMFTLLLLLILGLVVSIGVGYLLWTKLAAPVPFSGISGWFQKIHVMAPNPLIF